MKNFNKIITIFLLNIFGIFFLLTLLQYFNILEQNFLISTKLSTFLAFSSFLLIFLQYFENAKKERKEKVREKLKKIFPFALSLQALFSFLVLVEMEFLTNEYIFPYILLMITVAFLWTHRGEIRERKEDLGLKHAMFFLMAILIVFTFVKAPHFEKTLTGEHAMKYNTHVEPAKYMYEQNNPFWSQRKYLADPFTNPEGISASFGSPPLNEWGLFLTYKLLPNNSLEMNTRLFTHFLGILILILSFIFFSKWFTRFQSLIIVFLISINPIVNLSSFVTIEDSWLIIFTFLSLIFLSKYIKEDNISYLFYTGLLLGIGNTNKASIFLWAFPIIFVILAFKSKSLQRFLRDILIVPTLSLVPIVAFKTSLSSLPSDPFVSLIKFALWILFFFLLFQLLRKYEKRIEIFFEIFAKKRKLLPIALLLLFFFSGVFLYYSGIYKLSNSFLTDSNLIFNWEMYSYMLNQQFKNYATENLFYLGLVGLPIVFFFNDLKKKKILLAFLIGSVFFWVLASKSIFFHNYYTNIIMITLSLSAGLVIFTLCNLFKNRFAFFFVLLSFLFLIYPKAYLESSNILSHEYLAFYLPTAEFLKENVEEGGVIRPGTVHSASSIVSLYSGVPSFYEEKFLNFQDGNLKDFGVEYVLTYRGEGFKSLNMVINAESEEQIAGDIDRTKIIQERLGQQKTVNEFREVKVVHNVGKQLDFVRSIEGIDIYKVRD